MLIDSQPVKEDVVLWTNSQAALDQVYVGRHIEPIDECCTRKEGGSSPVSMDMVVVLPAPL